MKELGHGQSTILEDDLGRLCSLRLPIILQLLRLPPLPIQIGHILLLAVLKDRADGHCTGSRACRLLATKGVTRAPDLVFLLFDPHLGCFQGALRHDSLLLERGHSIVAQVLIEGVDHCVDRLLATPVAVGRLMVRLGPCRRLFALVAIREGADSCEVLLRLICVDLLAIELGVLRDDFRLDDISIFFIDLFSDFWDRCWCQIFGHIGKLFLIAWAKYEQSVNYSVLCLDPIDETRA